MQTERSRRFKISALRRITRFHALTAVCLVCFSLPVLAQGGGGARSGAAASLDEAVEFADPPNREKPADPEKLPDDLTGLSILELMDLEVSSVRKKTEKVKDAACAIYVITQEDLRRSGAQTIPDALRMVPGLEVAQIDANKWAVTSRGFNGRFANKLLVLIDGRSVYTPLFSGVFWDIQDVLLEDIDRIEVIRGPGGALWGANAVNGVINIITRNARDTQGFLASGGGGNEEHGFGHFRFGGAIGSSAHYRIYGKYFNRDGFSNHEGDHTRDDWDSARGGFRVDWVPGQRDQLTFIGDLFYTQYGNPLLLPTFSAPFSHFENEKGEVFGGDILARWSRSVGESSEVAGQVYYDRTDRRDPTFEEARDTFDIDVQHRFPLPLRQEILWGVNYRFTLDNTENSDVISLDPGSQDNHLASLFLQDDVTLLENLLRLTIGSKFDYNDRTRFEVQPSARLLWTPHDRHSFWSAVSRAVRTPSRADEDSRVHFLTFPPNPTLPAPFDAFPTEVALVGNRRFQSENLLAVELGYRTQPIDRLSVDIAAFYNHYDHLLTLEPQAPQVAPMPAPHFIQPYRFDNRMSADAFGIEAASTIKVLDWWKLAGGYTFLTTHMKLAGSSANIVGDDEEDRFPHHQANARSQMDLPWGIELDAAVYYVDSLRKLGIPGYIRADFRLGWRPFKKEPNRDWLDLSVVLQNAFDERHKEFGRDLFEVPSEVERSLFGVLTLRF